MPKLTEIATAYFTNNQVAPESIPEVLLDIARTLNAIEAGNLTGDVAAEPLVPAVSIKKSVTPDAIICLEDGRAFKSLKRHLRTHYDMSPEEYRAKWGLSHDYPMVAPNYAATRSALAKTMGLGQRHKEATVAAPKATKKGGK